MKAEVEKEWHKEKKCYKKVCSRHNLNGLQFEHLKRLVVSHFLKFKSFISI